jgi:HSP20 family molecular chaperone IbpA
MKPDAPELKTKTDSSLASPDELIEHAQDVSNEIARRAYELFEKRGGAHGNDWDDWFLAQSQLLKPVNFHLMETDDHFIAHAEVPGFSPHEIRVSVEPHRVRICGKAETPDQPNDGEAVMYSLGHSLLPAEHIFHVAELPAEVDPSKANVAFKDGKLEIVMQKVVPAKSLRAQAKGA